MGLLARGDLFKGRPGRAQRSVNALCQSELRRRGGWLTVITSTNKEKRDAHRERKTFPKKCIKITSIRNTLESVIAEFDGNEGDQTCHCETEKDVPFARGRTGLEHLL